VKCYNTRHTDQPLTRRRMPRRYVTFFPHTPNIIIYQTIVNLVAWHSGRTSVSSRRTLPYPALNLQLMGDR